MTLSALVGLIVAVAFTVSIPMYADGALKRVVSQKLTALKLEGKKPGALSMTYQLVRGQKNDLKGLEAVNHFIRDELPHKINFPSLGYSAYITVPSAEIKFEDKTKVDESRSRTLSLASMSGLCEHVTYIHGSKPSNETKDGIIEASMLEEGMLHNDLHVGDMITYPVDANGKSTVLRIKIKGVFQAKDWSHPYWGDHTPDHIAKGLYVNSEVLNAFVLDKQAVPIQNARWCYTFDLKNIQTGQIGTLLSTLERLDMELYQKLKDTKVETSFGPLLEQFYKEGKQLTYTLFALAVPMIAMVFYFISMNARQSLQKQSNDIAVLRSRGASAKQIFMLYLYEGVLLGVVSIVIGPIIGFFMAKGIGSARGFLDFVNRKSIPLGLNHIAVGLGFVAVFVAIIASLIPAITYAQASIVGAKRRQARLDQAPLWQRYYMDIGLLLLVVYGYYSLVKNQALVIQTKMSIDQIQMDPVLFLVPALAIFSLGLFFLRLFPFILKCIQWFGSKYFSVPVYLTLNQLSRSAIAYYPLMILLILTLGLGVYNSSAARTIDLNEKERTYYEYGADVVVETVWEGKPESSNEKDDSPKKEKEKTSSMGMGKGPMEKAKKTVFFEPPFQVFRQLEGVKHVARVLETKGSVSVSGKSIGVGNLVGIDNVDFAKVAWFGKHLFPVSPHKYLNFLGLHEAAILIPQQVAQKYQLKVGDPLSITINDQPVDFIVFGIVPYWPSQYPDIRPFFVANLDYVYDQSPLSPYKVWMKMKPEAKVAPIIKKLTDAGIELLKEPADVRSEIARQEKLPSRGGTFGILSLGFLVSMMISLIGYVLYWFFNLSRRVVQLGVLRAMGLSKSQLSGMLLLEQVFTAGLSVVLGIGIGRMVSYFFLPFLQKTTDIDKQIPPFKVMFEAVDMYKLYGVTVFMIMIGAGMLLWKIRTLRVHQAVKMGEE